jgi:hypothetical protein
LSTTDLTLTKRLPGTTVPASLRFRYAWIAVPLVIAVTSRVFSIVLLLQYQRQALSLPLLGPFRSVLAAWDGQWYLQIASTGYHAQALQNSALDGGHHDFAFYPGWPTLVRVLSINGALPLDVVAVVAANALFVVAAIVAYRLFAERFSERTALWATLLLAFNPVAYVFSMAYTEALFVLLLVLYFANRYGRAAPALAGAATLVRISGVALGVSAGVMFLTGRIPRLTTFLVGAAVFIAFASWWTFIWQLTGSFTGWFEGSAAWNKYEGILSIMRDGHTYPIDVAGWLAFVTLMVVGSILLLRRHTDMAIYGLAAIAMSLIGAPSSSMPRHAMVAVPAFAAFADRLGAKLSAALLVVFALGQVWFVHLAFTPGLHKPP